ncbi:MAG: type II toxin-antitoxin system BrnA family antitoxin [Sulfuricella sp.]
MLHPFERRKTEHRHRRASDPASFLETHVHPRHMAYRAEPIFPHHLAAQLQEHKRVNVDFPTWMIESLDREAGKLGVTRQSIIKVWLAERLEESASK